MKHLTWLFAVGVGLVIWSNAAFAFSPLQCGSSWVSVPFNHNMSYWKHGINQGDTDKYQNRIHWYWPVLANANVNQIKFYYDANWTHTQQDHDYFGIQDSSGWWWESGPFTSPSQVFYPIRDSWPRTYSKLTMEFDSDTATKDKGVKINSASVTCDTDGYSGNYNTVELLRNTDVILAGTGDTVYFKVLQPAFTQLAVAMHAMAVSPSYADFDIYGSTTTPYPDHTNHNWEGWSSEASEAFITDYSGINRWVYFTVNSLNGKGHARVTITPVNHTEQAIVACPFLGYVPTSIQQLLIFRQLQRASELWFGLTDGQTRINRIDYYNYYRSDCQIIFHNIPTVQTQCLNSCSSNWYINISSNNWQPYTDLEGGKVVAHELGHCIGCIGDETFHGGSCDNKTWCGHSIMGDHRYTYDLCGSTYHGLDPEDGTCTNSSPGDSSWTQLCNSGSRNCYTVRTGTPDPTDYFYMGQFSNITPVYTH